MAERENAVDVRGAKVVCYATPASVARPEDRVYGFVT